MAISEAAFRKLALEEPDEQWELDCGIPRRKPGMTAQHNRTMIRLAVFLFQQLDRRSSMFAATAGTSADLPSATTFRMSP